LLLVGRIVSQLGDTGLEHPSLALSKTPILTSGGAKSDAPNAPNTPQTPQDPDLALVVKCWPNLSEHIKAAVKALVESYRISESKKSLQSYGKD
jgi:hypothetical protein